MLKPHTDNQSSKTVEKARTCDKADLVSSMVCLTFLHCVFSNLRNREKQALVVELF